MNSLLARPYPSHLICILYSSYISCTTWKAATYPALGLRCSQPGEDPCPIRRGKFARWRQQKLSQQTLEFGSFLTALSLSNQTDQEKQINREKKAKISKDLNATQISASDILAVTSCASALEAWCMSLEV